MAEGGNLFMRKAGCLLPTAIFGSPYIVKCIGKSANSIMILVAAAPTITGPLYDQDVSCKLPGHYVALLAMQVSIRSAIRAVVNDGTYLMILMLCMEIFYRGDGLTYDCLFLYYIFVVTVGYNSIPLLPLFEFVVSLSLPFYNTTNIIIL